MFHNIVVNFARNNCYNCYDCYYCYIYIFQRRNNNNMCYYLCGGVFLSLIIEAKVQGNQIRNAFITPSSTPNNAEILRDLIKLFYSEFNPQKNKTFPSDVSKYKRCKKNFSDWLPFDDDALIAQYDNKVNQDYSSAYTDMREFAHKNINLRNKGKWLTRAILFIIDKDTSIQYPFITAKGVMRKSDLLNQQEYDLIDLLLATWHYILLYRRDNTNGLDTINHIISASNSFILSLENFKEKISLAEKEPIKECKENDIKSGISTDTQPLDTIKTNDEAPIPPPPVSSDATINDTKIKFGEIEILSTESDLLKNFIQSFDALIQECINTDFTVGFRLELADEIELSLLNWQFKYLSFKTPLLRKTVIMTYNTLSELFHLITEPIQYWCYNANSDLVTPWFIYPAETSMAEWKKNHDWLSKILRPESVKLRFKLRDLYRELHPDDFRGMPAYEDSYEDWFKEYMK